jgi:uncharacterized protein YbgA (DUF1722 family)/uncharacterized protein YbbK (DUF523 family)
VSVAAPTPIRIGVSSCLLGQEVRFDGGHKRDPYIVSTLGQYFEYVPLCPEVAIGLGIPRPPIQLVGDPAAPKARGVRDPRLDVTDRLADYGRRMAEKHPEISGYIFKSRSPSCGLERVKLYAEDGRHVGKLGVGVYARAFTAMRPFLPVEEEGRLNDPVLRENFVERVFAFRRWQELVKGGLSPAGLVDFHTRHKLSVMAHGDVYYRRLGRLVADAGRRPMDELAAEYVGGFMEAMSQRATRKRHTNVLMHLMGYLKRHLDRDDKAELLEIVERYRIGQVPLIVPITLLKHHFRRFPDPYVARQVYLDPHPRELMLRNSL